MTRTHKGNLKHLRAELENRGVQVIGVRLNKRTAQYVAHSATSSRTGTFSSGLPVRRPCGSGGSMRAARNRQQALSLSEPDVSSTNRIYHMKRFSKLLLSQVPTAAELVLHPKYGLPFDAACTALGYVLQAIRESGSYSMFLWGRGDPSYIRPSMSFLKWCWNRTVKSGHRYARGERGRGQDFRETF